MSVLPAPRTLIPDKQAVPAVGAPSIQVGVPPAPHMITEQRVVFGAAAALPPPLTHWWTAAARVVALAAQRVFLAYPPRLAFLDDSRMQREMRRL